MTNGRLVGLLETLLRMALGLLFLYAGAVKLLNVPAFMRDLAALGMFSHWAATVCGYAVPLCELVCGVWLLAGRAQVWPLFVLTFLASVFLGMIGVAWLRGIPFKCSCFGSDRRPMDYVWLMVRDVLILAALIVCLLRELRRLVRRARPPGDAAVVEQRT